MAGGHYLLEDQLVLGAKTDVVICGSYQATDDNELPGPSDLALWPTVCDASQAGTRALLATNVSRCAVERIVFTGGRLPYSKGPYGGGLYLLDAANFLLNRCVISNNHALADVSGGGIAISGSASGVTVSNCTISANTHPCRSPRFCSFARQERC